MNEADQKLSDCLAVHVMGLVRDEPNQAFAPYWRDAKGLPVFLSWNPVENANDTQRLKAKMIEDGYAWEMESHFGPDKTWRAAVYKDDDYFDGQDPNELRAVCLAAKAARESE